MGFRVSVSTMILPVSTLTLLVNSMTLQVRTVTRLVSRMTLPVSTFTFPVKVCRNRVEVPDDAKVPLVKISSRRFCGEVDFLK